MISIKFSAKWINRGDELLIKIEVLYFGPVQEIVILWILGLKLCTTPSQIIEKKLMGMVLFWKD